MQTNEELLNKIADLQKQLDEAKKPTRVIISKEQLKGIPKNVDYYIDEEMLENIKDRIIYYKKLVSTLTKENRYHTYTNEKGKVIKVDTKKECEERVKADENFLKKAILLTVNDKEYQQRIQMVKDWNASAKTHHVPEDIALDVYHFIKIADMVKRKGERQEKQREREEKKLNKK